MDSEDDISDVDLELLPDGLDARDFIEYRQIPVVRTKLYDKDDLPPHPLFGDKAVIRKELLKDDPIKHSRLWLKIVSETNPELIPKENAELNVFNYKPEYLQYHLVDEPIRSKLLPSVIPRKHADEENLVKIEKEREKNKMSKKVPVINSEAMEKLKETLNFSKYYEGGETTVDEEDE